jgi:hypothetical protein
MRKLTLISAILIILFVLSNITQAENNLSVSYSPTNITKAMDLALRTNSTSYLSTSPASQTDSAKKVSARPDSVGLRSPNKALLIAVFPGFIAHGSGHFYARKSLTGLALFTAEAAGLILWLRGSNFMGGSSGGPDTEQAEFITGMALFFGSWAYDLIGAPLAVNKENEKLMKESK